MAASDDLLTLATVVRPQGRRGEVLCDLLTDFPAQFTEAAALQLTPARGEAYIIRVESYWQPTGRNVGRVVLKLVGVDSISDAEPLRGAAVQMPREQRVAVDESTYYVADLVGCDLYDGDRLVGRVNDVQFPTDSSGKHLLDAAALFVVETALGASLLVPFANEFVASIDVPGHCIRMSLPPGLADLNQ